MGVISLPQGPNANCRQQKKKHGYDCTPPRQKSIIISLSFWVQEKKFVPVPRSIIISETTASQKEKKIMHCQPGIPGITISETTASQNKKKLCTANQGSPKSLHFHDTVKM